MVHLASLWKKCHASVCSLNYINKDGIRGVIATGFKLNHFIITDDYTFQQQDFGEVQIYFVAEDGITVTASKTLSFGDFSRRILNAAIEDYQGFLVIDAGFEEFENIPSLEIEKQLVRDNGDPVAVLGYRYDQCNLSIMSGIISSQYYRNNHRLIEIDTTIRQGCSGAPLLHAETGKVIGIVGYRLASMQRSYNQIIKIINDNLKMLKDAEGKITIQEIDPIQVLTANQNQIKHMVRLFFKATDIRTAIAYDVQHLKDYLHDMHLDADEKSR
ncbi:MAG: trypsin-like peptidase domain-containing protein [Bacteroidales bacterium]|nr:trypsin-like peptidase domain-containing protein [Bacteroidales bacterium]